MPVPARSPTDPVSLAANTTSLTAGASGFEVWLALGGLGVLVVGYLFWYFFVRTPGD